ncbi:MAG: T9SS type A sorting domain-containing protein [Paludibacter sp.]|nr:T9SS type A sorting domain-containing protein [Paludibacter sp.]
MKKIILSIFALALSVSMMAIDPETDWTKVVTGWSSDAATHELSFTGTATPAAPAYIATTFGGLTSNGATVPNWNCYAGLTLSFDAYISSVGTDWTSVVLRAKGSADPALIYSGNKGVMVQVSNTTVQARTNMGTPVKLSTDDATYASKVIAGAYNSFIIKVTADGTITVTINGYQCPANYPGASGLSVLVATAPAGSPALICTSFTGFKLKNVVVVKEAGTIVASDASTQNVSGGTKEYFTYSMPITPIAMQGDWWPQAGQGTTPPAINGWYYDGSDESLNFGGSIFAGTACATTLGSIGAPYADMSIKFDATMPAPGSGKSTIIILGSNATWGGLGIVIEYTEFGVRALKNFDYSGMTWLGSGGDYTTVLGAGGLIANNEINISATGLISLKFGTFVCPTTYQADVTVLANTFVMVAPFATGFKFKNVIAKKGAVAKSYFPNYSYAIAATSIDELKGTVTGAGTYDKTSDVTLVATATGGNQFVNWTEGGVEVSTSATYTFSATAARTLVANFSVTTGLNQPTQSSLSVYPNPSKGDFTISSDAVGKEYRVTNLLGQFVTSGVIGSKNQKLDLTNQQAGTYMVIIHGENGKIVKSIIKN